MQKVLIIHGCVSPEEKEMMQEARSYDKHWIPWVKKELETKDINVEAPLMPEPWEPVYEKFKAKLEEYEVNEESILIGFSCGGAFLVRWLGDSKKNISKLILVAPWKIAKPEDKHRQQFYTYDVDETIKDRVGKIIMFTSDDEKEEGKQSLKIYQNSLGGKTIELHGKGHFVLQDMGSVEFPELLQEILI